jgi:hypothetical protein
MSAGKLPKCESDGPTNKSGENKTEYDGGPGKFDRRRGTKQQSCTDRPAYRDHGHLPSRKLVAQP